MDWWQKQRHPRRSDRRARVVPAFRKDDYTPDREQGRAWGRFPRAFAAAEFSRRGEPTGRPRESGGIDVDRIGPDLRGRSGFGDAGAHAETGGDSGDSVGDMRVGWSGESGDFLTICDRGCGSTMGLRLQPFVFGRLVATRRFACKRAPRLPHTLEVYRESETSGARSGDAGAGAGGALKKLPGAPKQ